MASLADTIKQNQGVLTRDTSGQLTEENPEEIQNLAQKAGLAAPPTTPLGGAMLGATPQQYKMMGTPNQKQAALNLAMSPQQNLQDTLRRQQVRTVASGSEQAEKQKSQDMQNLGSLGQRVTDFITAQKQKLEASQVPTGQVQAASTVTTAAGNQLATAPDLKQDLDALRKAPTDMNAMLKVNQDLGYDSNTQLSPDQINKLYEDQTAALARAGGTAVDNSLTADDLINQGGLGYTKDQLSSLLGVPADQVGNMTVAQVRDQVNQLISNEFNKTQGLEQKAQSGELGVAERGEARQAGREASATGIRSTEADMGRLEQSIQNADQVQFNGQSMSVEDMLSSDNISKTITDYLNAGPGSPERTALEKNEPQLVDFINKNQAVLTDAANQLSQSATKFQGIQADNKALVETSIPADIAKDIIPGYGQLSAENINPNKVPILSVASHLDPASQIQFKQDLSQMTAKDPSVAAQIGGLNEQQVARLGLDKPASANPMWKQFADQEDRYQQIQNTGNVDDVVKALYGPNDSSSYKEDLKQNAINDTLGIGNHSKALDLLDADHDGNPDSLADIKSRLAGQKPTMRSLFGAEKPVTDVQDYSSPNAPEPWDKSKADSELQGDEGAIKSALQQTLGKYVTDGKLDPGSVAKVYGKVDNSKSSDIQSNIQELTYLQNHGNLSPETQRTIRDLLAKSVGEIHNRVGAHEDQIFDMKDFGPMNMNNAGTAQYWGKKLQDLDSVAAKEGGLVGSDDYGNSMSDLHDKISQLVDLSKKPSINTEESRQVDNLKRYLSDILTQRRKNKQGGGING